MIGVFGGTFDPVHCGHLRAIVELRDTLGLDEVRVVPCARPPHRAAPVAPADARVAMLRAALRDMRACVLDERELARPGPSYTFDTLTALRRDAPSAALCLLLGYDAFAGLDRWHRWRELFTLAHVVVAKRPGAAARALPKELADESRARAAATAAQLRDEPAGRVHYCETTELAISSTRLRAFAAARRSLQWLVPDDVARLIETNAWYMGELNG